MRGEEILSGAQRVHDPVLLEQRIKEAGINPADMQNYLDAFKLGCPPHGVRSRPHTSSGGGAFLLRSLSPVFCAFHRVEVSVSSVLS